MSALELWLRQGDSRPPSGCPDLEELRALALKWVDCLLTGRLFRKTHDWFVCALPAVSPLVSVSPFSRVCT